MANSLTSFQSTAGLIFIPFILFTTAGATGIRLIKKQITGQLQAKDPDTKLAE